MLKKDIKIKSDYKQGYFKVSNPIYEEVKLIDKHKIITTKADQSHHGFGISNIVHTVKKYEGTTEIQTEQGVFTLEVQLKLNQGI